MPYFTVLYYSVLVQQCTLHPTPLLQTALAALHLLDDHPLLPLAEDPVEGQVGGGVGRHTATRGQLKDGFIIDPTVHTCSAGPADQS